VGEPARGAAGKPRRIAQKLARWRVPLGYVLAIVAFYLASPTPASLAIGTFVGAIGEAFRVWAAGHLAKGREVTTSGPYALTRHPLYVGSSIMGAGFAIGANSVPIAVLVLGYLAVTITAAIRAEEAHLTEKFGAHYPAYRDGVAATADRRFSLDRALRNREYRALGGFVFVTGALYVKCYLTYGL
jgi:protein-S-isoprenylcysteine O-methyltransferase Ste14